VTGPEVPGGETVDVGLAARLRRSDVREAPLWLFAILAILALMALTVATNRSFAHAFEIIIPGITTTLRITLVSFVISVFLGLIAGLGRVSRNFVLRNVEIFRAGVESVPKGQMEAGRSLGLTHAQTMRSIILPQAIRTVLPALGNDFIALLKDSALATLLGVRDLTQSARLYTGRTFRFDEAFLVLTFLYLSMTLVLSLLVQYLQRRLGRG